MWAMDEQRFSENVWARGLADTRRALHSISFWLFEMAVGVVGAFLTDSLLAVPVLMIAVLILFWAAAIISAPFRQRNEARAKLEDFARGKLSIVSKYEYGNPDNQYCDVSVVARNVSDKTVKNVMASVESIRSVAGPDDISSEVIGLPLTVSVPIGLHAEPPSSIDLHSGQEVSFEVGRVGRIPGNIAFTPVRKFMQIDASGKPWYTPGVTSSIPAGHYRVCVVVHGEDVPQERMVFEFNSSEDSVEVRQINGAR